MTPTAVPLSVFDAPPLETGGTVARQGFAFQDHVTAGFCIDLISEPNLTEVWCETQDDCTLLRQENGQVHVEYVQSKNTNPGQFWSTSLLCNRGPKGEGHSILEKSLAYDRCRETCSFRIVSSCDVNSDLRPLTYRLGAPGRRPNEPDMINLYADVNGRVGTYRSPNGHDSKFWLDRTVWDVRHSDAAVKNENLSKLTRALYGRGIHLAPDQAEELYAKIVGKVSDASLLNARSDPLGKRIRKTDFVAWLKGTVDAMISPTAGAEELVREKMGKALLAQDMIMMAIDQRRYYREEMLIPKYLPLDHRQQIERGVSAVLQQMKSRLDNGEIPDDGVVFHAACLKELERLQNALEIEPRPPLWVLQGCMYNMTGRCVHRFRRATA